ncbi:hypothetical protein OROMI_006360 [Orobanche minor]
MHHLHLFTIFTFLLSSTAAINVNNHGHRRLLHQPLFPVDQTPPPTAIPQPPFSSPSPQPQPQQPKYPFSTLSPPTTKNGQKPFFPTELSPPPPSPRSATTSATIPANISSLVLPSSSHSSHKPTKLISLIATISLFSIFVIVSLVFLLLRHHHHHDQFLKSDSLRLFPPNTTPSDTTTITTAAVAADTTKKPPPPLFPHHTRSATSSEFLYLGTLVSSRDSEYVASTALQNDVETLNTEAAAPTNYQRLGSPELLPLPPLPRQHSGQIYHNTHRIEEENYNEEDEEEFFSPRESTANNTSPYGAKLSSSHNNANNNGNEFDKTGTLDTFNCNSPAFSISPDNSPSVVLNSDSPRSMLTKSPDSSLIFPAPLLPRFMPPPPARQSRTFSVFSPSSTEDGGTRHCSPRVSDFAGVGKTTPPPPPPPPALTRLREPTPPTGPPELVAPSRRAMSQNVNGEKGGFGNAGSKSEEMVKPKLKPLHWDKVRASSDRVMAWDHLKSNSSFQLNEEMIETLFTVNTKDGVRRHIMPDMNQENLVLDPKKSQNIAILLRALNVTVHEVCDALIEGNADALGTELLESLLKMGPTKEEERKLMEFKNESPLKLGTAEAFLKAVLNIPSAFKRIDAMLYVSIFESEIEHLKRSFHTLETACEELKSSRMFLKLLEAVLKTGNRMNIGTNRGDAEAFKLDTLLKLVDIKGADGKTTLLHFVVQETIKAEGARSSTVASQIADPEKNRQSTLGDEVEFKKLGLQVVSRLSGELTNVKKAASMDSDVLSNDVAKLAGGISKIKEVLKMNEESGSKFTDNMTEFLKKAEADIGNIQAQEGIAFSMVKGLTDYFHGSSGKEEARPLRLFIVVRDFLCILDRVCKDVGKINERAMVNSGRQIQTSANGTLITHFFPGFSETQQSSSSDDETSSSF